jgi:flagellar biosynthetic protein FlhB
MAGGGSGGDKTEKATPKRKEEARKKGQVAKSPDLNGSVVLLAALFALAWYGPHVWNEMGASMRHTLAMISTPQAVTGSGVAELFLEGGKTVLLAVGPVALVCLVSGVLVNLGQVKWKPSAQGIKPDFKRIDPLKGAKNLFGPNLLFEGAKNVTKVLIVAAITAFAVIPEIENLAALVGMSPSDLVAKLARTVLSIAQRAAIAYVLIGLADYAYQRWRTEKSMRMDKQEVKEEHKSFTSPPEVRSAMRRRQMQAAKARMMSDVPEADVVVTNPTHYAVALRYDGQKPAPEVLAKGQDLVAAQIRRIAEENGVPVIADPPLARSLHASVEVGHQVPEELFAAVAQLLAFVYRVAGRKVV